MVTRSAFSIAALVLIIHRRQYLREYRDFPLAHRCNASDFRFEGPSWRACFAPIATPSPRASAKKRSESVERHSGQCVRIRGTGKSDAASGAVRQKALSKGTASMSAISRENGPRSHGRSARPTRRAGPSFSGARASGCAMAGHKRRSADRLAGIGKGARSELRNCEVAAGARRAASECAPVSLMPNTLVEPILG